MHKPVNSFSAFITCTLLFHSVFYLQAAYETPRPKLQIINGSNQVVDVFWLKTADERVSNGSIAPSSDTIITTTIGHQFLVVGRDDQSQATITSDVAIQGFRFDPSGKDGVPEFYSQRVSANGFPIVASDRVNPYALKEAVYLVNMMLAKRPDVRLTGHLEDYDPTQAPSFVWPERLKQASIKIHEQAKARDKAAQEN